MKPERVVENLNRGLRQLLETDARAILLGEDVRDPYGGAFKVTKGLSTAFPDRVLNTPISENAIVGFASGLALDGYHPVVEIMFGDFMTLAFDQIINFASKSVTMYGRRVPMNLLVRCAVGGGRGYGPTHSQSVQKFFLGYPNLELYEMNPFVDATELVPQLLGRGKPCILFESKTLLGSHMRAPGELGDCFRAERDTEDPSVTLILPEGCTRPQCLLVTSGACVERCLEAARSALLEAEIEVGIAVLTRLYPLSLTPLTGLIDASTRVLVVEESSGAGTWGAELTRALGDHFWGRLSRRVRLVQSLESVIPAAFHLEKQVLVQTETISRAIVEGFAHA
jgi:pyruvate dehydrogenase E1 component beta subunit